MHPPDALRLCDEPGCAWVGQHAENCKVCLGWGWLVQKAATRRVWGEDVADWQPTWKPVSCAVCHGTPLGRMDPLETAETTPDASSPT